MTSRKRTGAETPSPPVIIVKRQRHKGGHHGGSWKVAYADFVTTMMALFIVLWAAGQDTKMRQAIGSYFRNPAVIPTVSTGTGVLPAGSGIVDQADLLANDPAPERESRLLRDAANSIRQEIEKAPDLRPLLDQVQITLTQDGLRIQMAERDEHLFFEVGSARVKPDLTRLLTIIAASVGKLPNSVAVEGHTDSRQYQRDPRAAYSNWELSADRANSARRVLESEGLRPRQIVRVVGFADHDLHIRDNPLDARNRRVTILVHRQNRPGRLADVAEQGPWRLVGHAEAQPGQTKNGPPPPATREEHDPQPAAGPGGAAR